MEQPLFGVANYTISLQTTTNSKPAHNPKNLIALTLTNNVEVEDTLLPTVIRRGSLGQERIGDQRPILLPD
jgi:hypothetical protein